MAGAMAADAGAALSTRDDVSRHWVRELADTSSCPVMYLMPKEKSEKMEPLGVCDSDRLRTAEKKEKKGERRGS